MPPAPMPWNERPISSMVNRFEAADIVAPTKKDTRLARSYAIQQVFEFFPEECITHDGLSSEDVGKRGKCGLDDRRGEQVGGAGPECLNACAMKIMGDEGKGYGDGGTVQRCCQRGDGEGSEDQIESPSQ